MLLDLEIVPSTAPRGELLAWLNSMLPDRSPTGAPLAPMRRVEHCSSCVAYCLALPDMLPVRCPALLTRVKVPARLEFDAISNLKLVTDAFQRNGIARPDVLLGDCGDKMIRGNFQANLQMLQWFKGLHTALVEADIEPGQGRVQLDQTRSSLASSCLSGPVPEDTRSLLRLRRSEARAPSTTTANHGNGGVDGNHYIDPAARAAIALIEEAKILPGSRRASGGDEAGNGRGGAVTCSRNDTTTTTAAVAKSSSTRAGPPTTTTADRSINNTPRVSGRPRTTVACRGSAASTPLRSSTPKKTSATATATTTRPLQAGQHRSTTGSPKAGGAIGGRAAAASHEEGEDGATLAPRQPNTGAATTGGAYEGGGVAPVQPPPPPRPEPIRKTPPASVVAPRAASTPAGHNSNLNNTNNQPQPQLQPQPQPQQHHQNPSRALNTSGINSTGNNGVSSSGSGGSNGTATTAVSSQRRQIAELEAELALARDERQFYYDKLRMVEGLVADRAAEDLLGPDVATVRLARSIRDICHSTN